MMQPLHYLWEFKPTALAYAISSLFITAGLAPLTAQAACTISGSVSTCNSPFDVPYKAPAAPSPTLNINGVQTFSGQAEWLFSIDQASNLSTINFDAELTWNNIDYKLVATPPGSLIGGAINIGNTSEHQAVSGSVFFESTQNSFITLNLIPTSFNADEPVGLSSIIINGNGSSQSSITTAHLNGNITINDVDHGSNLTRSLYGATIRNASASADIVNTGNIIINAAQQSNAVPVYYGLESQSYNNSLSHTPTYRLNNSGTISVTLPGTSGYTAKALDIVFRGAHSDISIENSGTIELTSTSTVADVLAVNITNDTASNAIYFTNTSTGKITNTFSSVVYPNNSAIKYEGSGSFFLTNEGNITSHIYTSSNTASTDSITNSNSIIGNINTYDGNDTLTNTAGSISGLIDLGLGDDALILNGGTLQNVQLDAGNDTSSISGGSAQNIDMGAGNDSSTWSGGGFQNHYSGDGADTFTITGAVSYALIQSINGNNANGIDDGSIDTLIFQDYTGALDTSKLVNWEAIHAGNNSQVTLNDNVTNPTAIPTEYTALAGGAFIVNNNFPALNANLTLQSGGSYIVGPGNTPTSHTINGNVNNAGTLNLANNTTSSSLTISGDYVGNNGVLALSTVYGDDSSTSNKLYITGAATGSTSLALSNMGGSGAQTDNGILLVQTGSSSANAFTLPGQYITVGAYDYSLVNRAENNNSNWYLTSTYVPPTPPPAGGGSGGGNTGGGSGGGAIPPSPSVKTPVYSPSLGSMLANQRAANTLFRMRLEEREGAAGYQQHQQKLAPWVRYYSVKNQFDSVSGQLHTYGHNNAMQAGITLLSIGEESRLDTGVMLGYADYSSRSKNQLTQRKSTSAVHGYSVGAYATWYANPEQEHGTYVDTWALWNHFDNNTSAADGDKHKYKSTGALASVELGTDLGIGTLAGHSAWLQPQAQLVYHGVTPDHFHDKQGVKIDPGHANYEARLGLKAYLDIQDHSGADYRPYLAVNWIHNTDPYHVEIDNKDYTIRGMGNIGEVKLGLEGKLNANNQVWINTNYARGGNAQKEYGIDLGWQYSF